MWLDPQDFNIFNLDEDEAKKNGAVKDIWNLFINDIVADFVFTLSQRE